MPILNSKFLCACSKIGVIAVNMLAPLAKELSKQLLMIV